MRTACSLAPMISSRRLADAPRSPLKPSSPNIAKPSCDMGGAPCTALIKPKEHAMTNSITPNGNAVTLETAPTSYVEGHGIRFAYRRLGPSTGTPLILLQHFSGNIDAWDPAVVNALAAERPVIAFDNAGVGRSTGQTPDNVAAMARDAVAFINLLGFK